MHIPAYDVTRANAPYKADLHKAALSVLEGGALIMGTHLEQFERNFAHYCGTSYCIGVGNGLDALKLALYAAGVRAGDEVLVPAFTFIATWSAVSLLGAKPVPVDVTSEGLINPDLISAAITPRTRAIVPVHLYGRLADMSAILALAEHFGLVVIEDAAQAHGARRNGQRAGSFGQASAFSFYPTKNLGAFGDGGAICTNDADMAYACYQLRNYGSTVKYYHDSIGWNTRLDDLQAALLDIKLADLDASNIRRTQVAQYYHSFLSCFQELQCPNMGDVDMVWHHFVLLTEKRKYLQESLLNLGVYTGVHYPVAPFDQPCYKNTYNRDQYPQAITLSNTVLSLPMGDYLQDNELQYITSAIRKVCEAQKS